MKIGIITHYDVHNHGAALQMYALEQILRKNNYEVEGLKFHKNFDFLEEYAEKKYNITIKSVPYYLGYLYKNGFTKTYFNYNKKRILDSFKERHHMVGEELSQVKEIDAIFIGSDEVFSIESGLTPEFWGYNMPTPNIFSYAGCFGPTTLKFIEDKNAENFIKNGINNLKNISVRDENSKNIIEKLSNRNATLVCDPVILYGYIDEKKKFKKSITEKYVLVYSYDNNMNTEEEIKSIKKFAAEKNCKIYSVGFYHNWVDKNINCDPIELLEFVDNAEYVLTDTFHGTVMSLIMNTQFITKVHTNSNKLGFLLEEYECVSRRTNNFSDALEITKQEICYNKINDIIDHKRKLSMEYLNKCLESV